VLGCGYFVCYGQKTDSFRLLGTVNSDIGTIQLAAVGNAGDYPKDFNFTAVPIVHGRFLITGKIEHPYEVMLMLDTGGIHLYISGRFFIDTGNQSIVCDAQSLREIPAINNSTMWEYVNQYRSSTFQAFDTITNYKLQDSLEKRYLYLYAQKHPDSWVAIWMISHYLIYGYDQMIDSAFNKLSTNLQASNTGISVKTDLEHLALTGLGKIFPKFEVYSLNGKSEVLNYLNKNPKYILIDFWFSHCGPCIGQFPDYIQMVKKYQSKGFTMFGISSDTSAADIDLWKYIIKSNSLNWIQYRTTKATMNNLHIFLAPWNFLLDNEGRILGRDMETKEIANFLKTNLN
jgi:thiol-disulfide isomerase/thioredoxin